MFEGLQFRHWRAERDADGIVLLTLDREGLAVNALNRAVLDEFDQLLERLAIDPPEGLVICSGKPAGFVVGADLKEFEGFGRKGQVLDQIRNGQRVFERLARLPCPTAVAIHGHCMGGGTEIALACTMRVASRDPSTKIGLPEIKLGIIPGWGGTSRLPYLIGAPKALELMLTGSALSADKAKAIGLVDATTTPELLIETAKKLVRKSVSPPIAQRLLAWATNTWPARQVIAPMVRKQTAAKARPEHYPAPFALIETWRRGGNIRQRLEREAHTVDKLARGDTARNLVRVFFLMEALKGQSGKIPHGVEHVHVVGAGVMGGDIAAWCALRGFSVTLQDREMQYIQPALDRACTMFTKRLKTPERIDPVLARLVADVEGAGVARADVVIEAIFENLEAKQALYRDLEPRMKADALIASNTSSIPLAELASAASNPSRFVGLHYFNPVAQMPLVEIVRHPGLSEANEKRALAFAKGIDKLPIAVAGTPGFLVNRILMPYLLEALRIFAEGVPGPVIDKAAKKFGMPMGPIELADTVGLDVAASVGKVLGGFLNLDVPAGLDRYLEQDKKGKKTGEGLYVWKDGKPVKPDVDPDAPVPSDLEDRMILPLVNEAVACLHDGVVDTADLLDAGVIFGTGFAPFRGGPLQYLRETGIDVVKARLAVLEDKYGPRFAARPGWDNPALTTPAA
ncbi:MAG: 3-hydroxyacyl-CoA dehydrogenase NAD-binding domain-containing protein [Dokdonella sp.]